MLELRELFAILGVEPNRLCSLEYIKMKIDLGGGNSLVLNAEADQGELHLARSASDALAAKLEASGFAGDPDKRIWTRQLDEFTPYRARQIMAEEMAA